MNYNNNCWEEKKNLLNIEKSRTMFAFQTCPTYINGKQQSTASRATAASTHDQIWNDKEKHLRKFMNTIKNNKKKNSYVWRTLNSFENRTNGKMRIKKQFWNVLN